MLIPRSPLINRDSTLSAIPLSWAMRYRVLPLAEIVSRLACGKRLPVGATAISFDDGWRDNRDHALPELEQRGMGHVLLTGGGIISKDDMEKLRESGFARLFGPGARTEEIAEWIQAEMKRLWKDEEITS